LNLFVSSVIKQTVVIIEAYHCVTYVQNSIHHPATKSNAICRGNYWGIINADFDATDQLLIIYSYNGNKINYVRTQSNTTKKLNSVALVREPTIPTERPPPVGDVSANFCG